MKTIALLLALCSACVVVPKTTTTMKDLGTETGEIAHGPVSKVGLQAELGDATVEVSATAQRECSRPVYQVTEVRKEKHARYQGTKDARAGLFALFLAPVTIPITAIGTGIAVLADGDGTTTRTQKVVGTERFACTTVAAKVPIAVRLPSGATITETTDNEGTARVRIPDSEPYRGVVTVSGPAAATTELRYARAMPAITAVRETVMTCGALHHVSGKVKVELGIDGAGKPERIGVDVGDGSFARCVNDGLANTRFGDAHRAVKLVLPFELPG